MICKITLAPGRVCGNRLPRIAGLISSLFIACPIAIPGSRLPPWSIGLSQRTFLAFFLCTLEKSGLFKPSITSDYFSFFREIQSTLGHLFHKLLLWRDIWSWFQNSLTYLKGKQPALQRMELQWSLFSMDLPYIWHSMNYIFYFTESLYLLPEENRLLITAEGCFD